MNPIDPDATWPRQAGAAWPSSCLIENAAVHPYFPWLAVACTNAEDESGAVMIVDVESGTVRSSTPLEGTVGWAGSPTLLWHPDGQRLGLTVETNGIGLVRSGRLVGCAFPDETRDHAVGYVWVGDRLYTDTGDFFEIHEGDRRFDFEPITSLFLADLVRNTATGAVVGRVGDGVAAFDPIAGNVLYHTPLAGSPPTHGYRVYLSADGRWVGVHHSLSPSRPDEIQILSGDDGQPRWTLTASRPKIYRLCWGPDGTLLVACYSYEPAGDRYHNAVDIVQGGRIQGTVNLSPQRIISVAWSRAGAEAALLLDNQEVRLLDVRSRQIRRTFSAPVAHPEGAGDAPGDLLWASPRRLVRLGQRFISIWSTDGQKLAELTVP